MSIATHIDKIVAHLATAALQRSWHDDKIISEHIDMALEAARAAKAEIMGASALMEIVEMMSKAEIMEARAISEEAQ